MHEFCQRWCNVVKMTKKKMAFRAYHWQTIAFELDKNLVGSFASTILLQAPCKMDE